MKKKEYDFFVMLHLTTEYSIVNGLSYEDKNQLIMKKRACLKCLEIKK